MKAAVKQETCTIGVKSVMTSKNTFDKSSLQHAFGYTRFIAWSLVKDDPLNWCDMWKYTFTILKLQPFSWPRPLYHLSVDVIFNAFDQPVAPGQEIKLLKLKLALHAFNIEFLAFYFGRPECQKYWNQYTHLVVFQKPTSLHKEPISGIIPLPEFQSTELAAVR